MKRIILIICGLRLILWATPPIGNFLSVPPSAAINGMGQVGTSYQSTDPLSIFYNPANGLKAYSGLSVIYGRYFDNDYTVTTNYANQYSYNYFGLNLIPEKYPFKLVLSHQAFDFQLDDDLLTWETVNGGEYKMTSVNQYTAYSLSGGYENLKTPLPINISAGISFKQLEESMTSAISDDNFYKNEENLYDVGMIAALPFTFLPKSQFPDYRFSLTPSLGSSLTNIADLYHFSEDTSGMIEYSDSQNYRYTLIKRYSAYPRYFRIGLALSGAITHKSDWKIFEFHLARELGDLLITSDDAYYGSDDKYQSPGKDIQLIDNFILGNSKKIDVKTGISLSFLELLHLRYGSYQPKNAQTNGIGINSDGIFYALSYLTGNNYFTKMSHYFNFTYDYANTNEGYFFLWSDEETWHSYNNFSVKLRHLEHLWNRDKSYRKIPVAKNDLSLLAGFNYTHFYDKLFVTQYERKFRIGLTAGIEQAVGPITLNITYKQKNSKFNAPDSDDEDENELTIKNHFFNFGLLCPIDLHPKITLSPGIEIGHAPWHSFKLADLPNLNMQNAVNLLLCFDYHINEKVSLRTEYSHGLTQMYNTEILEFRNNSFQLYLKYNL